MLLNKEQLARRDTRGRDQGHHSPKIRSGCSREENIVTTSTREVQVMPVFVKDPLNSQVHGMVGQHDLS